MRRRASYSRHGLGACALAALCVAVGTAGAAGAATDRAKDKAAARAHPGHRLHPRNLPPGAERPDPSPAYLREIPKRDVKNRPENVQGTVAAIAGTAFLPVLLVDFSDNMAEAALHPPSAYSAMLFQDGYPIGAGSLRDFYQEQSGGLFDVTGQVSSSWLRMPSTYATYVGSSYGYQNAQPNDFTLVRDAAAAADASMNFCNGDTDGDGFVDSLFVVHAGPGAEEVNSGLWSVRWALPQNLIYTTNDVCGNGQAVKIKDFTIEPEEFQFSGYTAPGAPERMIAMGVFAHEFGHALGLPDLYDLDSSSAGGVGEWELMAGGSWGFNNHPWRPTPFGAWSKVQLGWAIPQNVVANRLGEAIPSVDAPHVGSFTGIFRLAQGGSPSSQEYFLVENRTKQSFATEFPGAGLAVWHVDDSLTTNEDDSHRWVTLLQADGLNELNAAGWSGGDSGDLFPGTANNRLLSGTTNPSTDLWSGVDSGISIANIGNAGATTAADLMISGVPTAANDAFASAQVLTGSGGSTSGTNVGATKEAGEPNHAGNPGGKSVWYTWTAPTSGEARLDTLGSSFNTLLAVYTGGSVGTLAPVASNDDASGATTQSALTFTATAGTQYRIAVDGFNGALGTIALAYSFGNDAFSGALPLGGSGGTVVGSSVGATKEAGEPNHAGNPGGHSVWWSFTAPKGGTLALNTAGSTFDTLLAVYTGSSVNSLTTVVANDDDPAGGLQSRIAPFTVTAGTTYRIAVDGYNGAAGTITLAYSFVGVGPTFADVPETHPFYDEIEEFYARGITTGCGTNGSGQLLFCPGDDVKRQAMAAFITRAMRLGPLVSLAPAFADVPTSHPFYGEIERFYAQGITTGCATTPQRLFCPTENVKRQAMAAFIVRARGLTPLLPATPTFADVPATHPFFGEIERFYAAGITTGCGTNGAGQLLFCPDATVKRQAMAAFLVRAFPAT